MPFEIPGRREPNRAPEVVNLEWDEPPELGVPCPDDQAAAGSELPGSADDAFAPPPDSSFVDFPPGDPITGEAAEQAGDAAALAATPAAPSSRVLPFRRPRNRNVRRRRRSPWFRWLRPLAAALMIVGLPAAFAAWLLYGASFAFTGLEVDTPPTGRVAKSWVHKALAPYGGQNLWRLDLNELEESLVAHPWIAEVGLRKRPPSTLEVRLVERREAALYRGDAGLVWIDFAGRPIEPVDLSRPDPGLDLPILSGSLEAVPAALTLLEEIHEAGQGWSEGLSEIEILGQRDFRVYTTSLPFPLVVRTGSLHEKARQLRALLPRLVERFDTIDAVDLRFARRIIIQQPEGQGPPGGYKQRA